MVSTPSLPSAAHQIAESVFLSDEDAREFLQRFPLVQILECVSASLRSGCVCMLLTHVTNCLLCCPDQYRLRRTLQRGSLSQQSTDYVCAALKKVFSTAFGRKKYLCLPAVLCLSVFLEVQDWLLGDALHLWPAWLLHAFHSHGTSMYQMYCCQAA